MCLLHSYGNSTAQAVLLLIPIEEVQVHQRIFWTAAKIALQWETQSLQQRVQPSPKLFHSSNELFLSGLGSNLTSARVVLTRT